ncbi:MAG TPA: hypothetical protein VL947_12640 [Cytophagales bacterium]|nr:hypothetical protein [Cytophagales bacterium]
MGIFTKHTWSKWESIGVTTIGYKTIDILRRECTKSGLVEYKNITIAELGIDIVSKVQNFYNKTKNHAGSGTQ